MFDDDDIEDHWDNDDELKWLESMNRRGKLNATGKRNLSHARKLKAERDSD
jgi:hypothetical protein